MGLKKVVHHWGKGSGPQEGESPDSLAHLLESFQMLMAGRALVEMGVNSGLRNSAKTPLVSWPWSGQSH